MFSNELEGDRKKYDPLHDSPFPSVLFSDLAQVSRIGEIPHILEILHQQNLEYRSELQWDNQHIRLQSRLQLNKKNFLVWLYFKIRSRYLDGTKDWERTVLGGSRNFSNPEVDLVPKEKTAIEVSCYALNPLYPLVGYAHPKFIKNPFKKLPFTDPTEENLRSWYKKWQEIMSMDEKDAIYPGYFCQRGIPKALSYMFAVAGKSLYEHGYTHLTAVPTWYHVAKSFENQGFLFTHASDAEKMQQLDELVNARIPLSDEEKKDDSCRRLIYARRSWLVMFQFWVQLAEERGLQPEQLIEEKDVPYILRDHGQVAVYPLSPDHNLWMERELSVDSRRSAYDLIMQALYHLDNEQ